MDEKQQKKIDKAIRALELANEDFATPEEVAGIFIPLNEKVDDLVSNIEKSHASIADEINNLDVKIDDSVGLIEESINELSGKVSSLETKPVPEIITKTEVSRLIDEKIPEPTDLEPLYEKLRLVEAKILPFPKQTVPQEVWKEFDDVQEQIEILKKEIKKAGISKGIQFFGSTGVQLSVDGVLKGSPAHYINFVGGNNVTFSTNIVGERIDVTVNATGGSGSFSVLTVTGTIDDSNTAFTTTSTPVVVVVNGASYRDGHGCTISGTNITLDNPVGQGGDIYAISG